MKEGYRLEATFAASASTLQHEFLKAQTALLSFGSPGIWLLVVVAYEVEHAVDCIE